MVLAYLGKRVDAQPKLPDDVNTVDLGPLRGCRSSTCRNDS